MSELVEQEIERRIAQKGRITFAEFMEVALYLPAGGYYRGGSTADSSGDYFTSPTAHPAFGALLAVQLREMWAALGEPDRFQVVEIGAGKGVLAQDIVESASMFGGGFRDSLDYATADRGAADYADNGVHGIDETDWPPAKPVVGCILSNELIDAFPVHLFQIEAGQVMERFVTGPPGDLCLEPGQPSTAEIERRVAPYAAAMPEGYRGEVNLGIAGWVGQLAQAIERGFALTVDYGYEQAEMYAPRRSVGTLQTYFRHAPGRGPLARVGEQDITAHVDFSALVSEGEAAGLKMVGLTTQRDFLRRLGFHEMLSSMRGMAMPSAERDANVMALRELVKPGGLGDFRVLVQQRAVDIEDLAQITPKRSSFGEGGLPVPLLGPRHLSLMRGRYPHLAFELDELWPQEAATRGP